eukprot:TRINITY_DN4167_c0_g1_i5.p1 TRINITY_DN4167_c0_g1~~TRINITY_DN4167_c0_g1_i5.p1  ORF type:complete len:607 (+),score=161.78 TRINITY_DN4167_c0_g1_i5:61-1881(+)
MDSPPIGFTKPRRSTVGDIEDAMIANALPPLPTVSIPKNPPKEDKVSRKLNFSGGLLPLSKSKSQPDEIDEIIPKKTRAQPKNPKGNTKAPLAKAAGKVPRSKTTDLPDDSAVDHNLLEQEIPVIFRGMTLEEPPLPSSRFPISPPMSPPIVSPKDTKEKVSLRNPKEPTKKLKENVKKRLSSGTVQSPTRMNSSDKLPITSKEAPQKPVVLLSPPSQARRKASASLGSPSAMLKQGKDKLSLLEQKEILEYQEIYFTGNTSINDRPRDPHGKFNKGYDDEKGDYRLVIGEHIAFRYEVLEFVGSGAFGQVVKVLDHKTHKICALKVIRNRKRYHEQAMVEDKILQYVKQKDPTASTNIVTMHDSFYFRNHICFTFPLLNLNLYDYIKENNFRGLSLSLIRIHAIKILTALKFLAKHHIIHCDLKPENILLNDTRRLEDITIIDFGSSCFDHEKVFTYIQSRFYRAPEIILGIPYTVSIDMWSLAAILAELYTGYPLFPGENELDELGCMMEVLGTPTDDILAVSTRRKYFFASNGKPRIIENSQGIKRYPGTRTLEELVPGADPMFHHFIMSCLRWNAKERLTPSTALQHPWIVEEPELEDGPYY